MLQIDNKFEIGQEVYVIWKVHSKNECPACKGEGHKIIDGNTYICKKCMGDGWLSDRKKIYQSLGMKTVFAIKTFKNENGSEIRYHVGTNKKQGYLDVLEKYLFENEEEALAECDRLNKKTED